MTITFFSIRPIQSQDHAWLKNYFQEFSGGEPVVTPDKNYYPSELPGFVALEESHKIISEISYAINSEYCEIATFSSLKENIGIGKTLFAAVEDMARESGCPRLSLYTTNDNLHALGWYQKRGMRITKIYPDAMDTVRAIKPNVPETGLNGIPLRDMLLLEKILT